MMKNRSNKYYPLVLFIIFLLLVPSVVTAVSYDKYKLARIQILNKITGKSEIHDISVGEVYNFDDKLSFIIKACYKATQRYTPENVMFLQVAEAAGSLKENVALDNNLKLLQNANKYIKSIDDNGLQGNNVVEDNIKNKQSSLVFSGWIFSNYPEISGLTDPTYDITLVKCLAEN